MSVVQIIEPIAEIRSAFRRPERTQLPTRDPTRAEGFPMKESVCLEMILTDSQSYPTISI